MIPAMFFDVREENKVKCTLCPHFCVIRDGDTGICGVRKNIRGELFSLNSDKVVAVHSDPIEKKPLYHFLPGSRSLSIAAMGCNFRCRFCQNYSISMAGTGAGITGEKMSPDSIVDLALRSGSGSVSYTYTEPTVYFELMFETARAARDAGLRNVMVSNGFISSPALEKLIPLMDGANIDLKSHSDTFYKKECGGRLQPILDSIRYISNSTCWLEVTTLLIPGLNTDERETERMISFLVGTDTEIPWHVSRFFPNYKAGDIPPTDTALIGDVMKKAEDAGLKYIYGGNYNSGRWEDTRCPECGRTLLSRSGYSVETNDIQNGKCRHCSNPIPGVWN
jgi:pyruvate formate lyase activating enzyme